HPAPTTLERRRLGARAIAWWRVRDSNPRPRRCERRALPTELTPPERSSRILHGGRRRANFPADQVLRAPSPPPLPGSSRGLSRSIGSGKNVVVFRSEAIS